MADETTTPAAGNTLEARTTDGTLKDQATPTTTAETKPASTEAEGTTLLTEGDKKPEVEAKPEDKKPNAKGVPEKYEFKAPEGYTYTPESIEKATGLFKEVGLTQDQASKLMDMYAGEVLEARKGFEEAGAKAIKDMNDQWIAETKADKDIGNKLPEVKTTIAKALDSLGDAGLVKAFRETMDATGIGNNPHFVKAFYRLAQSVTEGAHVAGRGPSEHGQSKNGLATKPTAAQSMYPNLPSVS